MHDDPELIAMVRDAHARGAGHEEVFVRLGGRGVSKSDAIVYYAKGAGVPGEQARRLVEASPLWADRHEEQEAFRDALDRSLFLLDLAAGADDADLDDPAGDEVYERLARARAHLAAVAALLPDEMLTPYREARAEGNQARAFAALVAAGRAHGLPEGGWRGLDAVADELCLDEWDGSDDDDFLVAARHLRTR